MAMTNSNIWNELRNKYPSFASHTAKATKEFFTEQGYEALKQTDPTAVNDFFLLSLRVKLLGVNASHAKDSFEENDFGEFFNAPFGGIVQKIAVNSVKPISPAYKNLKNGDSPDPFVVRKPVTSERFFKQNFDYASLITLPDEFQKKTIFINEMGMSEFTAAITEGLQNGYTIQKFNTKLEAINAMINSTTYKLQDTQKMNVNIADATAPTNEELLNFILAVMNVADAMQLPPQTGAYNAMKFESKQEQKRLKLLVRPGWKNRIMMALPQVFHYKETPLANLTIIEVPHFGGLVPYKEAALTTQIYPHYNALGEEDGWSLTEGGEKDDSIKDPFYKDPNANIFAMLADNRVVFEVQQNPYTVEPIRNPRGLYTNLWASSPDNTIAADPLYNSVLFGNF